MNAKRLKQMLLFHQELFYQQLTTTQKVCFLLSKRNMKMTLAH